MRRHLHRCYLLFRLACITVFTTSVNAENKTVYFHAWGGSPQINAYIEWVAEQVKAQNGIELEHIKLANTSDAVNQVLAQKVASPNAVGTIDLIWLNGENFASMADNDLLRENWATSLSNFNLTNPQQNPDVLYDFGVPTLGRESPWGRASLAFYYNEKHLIEPPKTALELLAWSKRQPNRFTYPHIDDFIGMSFVKYVLIASVKNDPSINEALLYQPVDSDKFDTVTQPLWAYLDKLHPTMWRKGRFFVRDNGWLKRIFDDEEILLALTFSAGNIPASVDRFALPVTTRTYTMQDGSLSNVHFVTIPFNAPNPQYAKDVANFLLSPIAQAEKLKPTIWGDATVLDVSRLPPEQMQYFGNHQTHPSALDLTRKILALKEPHPSWIGPLKSAWKSRYESD